MKYKILLIISFQAFIVSKGLSIRPDRNYEYTPDSLNCSHDKLTISTQDGHEINTWIYHANEDLDQDTVLILAGPDAGNMSYFVYYAIPLANAGYTVVTFDYRGFGQSSDFPIIQNYLYHTEFSEDVKAVVNAISARFTESKIGIWALSMGTAVTGRAYLTIKNKIDFIVGEAFITDTSYIIDRYLERGKKLMLPEALTSYAKEVKMIDVPLLIFSASEDQITTTSDARELQESLQGNCTVAEYQGKHLQGFQASEQFGSWYTRQITSFLSKI